MKYIGEELEDLKEAQSSAVQHSPRKRPSKKERLRAIIKKEEDAEDSDESDEDYDPEDSYSGEYTDTDNDGEASDSEAESFNSIP